MSLTIFLIAAIPAVVVYAVGVATQSRWKAFLTFILVAIFGVFAGNPIYALLDFVFAAGAYAIVHTSIKPISSFEEYKSEYGAKRERLIARRNEILRQTQEHASEKED